MAVTVPLDAVHPVVDEVVLHLAAAEIRLAKMTAAIGTTRDATATVPEALTVIGRRENPVSVVTMRIVIENVTVIVTVAQMERTRRTLVSRF